jgi:hypothetical protein
MEPIVQKVLALESVATDLAGVLCRIMKEDPNLSMNDIVDSWQNAMKCFREYDVFRFDEDGNPIPRRLEFGISTTTFHES